MPLKITLTIKYAFVFFLFLFFSKYTVAQVNTFSTTYYDEERNSDRAYNIVELKDGGFIMTSLTYCKDIANGCILVVKMDNTGKFLWRKHYKNPYAIEISNYQSLLLTEDENIVLSGSIYELEEEYNMFIFMLDSDGDSLWMQQYGGVNRDLARSLRTTSDSGYIITGLTTSFAQNERADVYLVKTDSLGNEEWSRTYGDVYGDMGISIEPDTDGGYVLGAYFETNDVNDRNRSGAIIKTDSLGEVLWQKQYGSAERPHGACIVQPSKFGGYFYVASGDTIVQEGYFGEPRYIARLDNQGNTEWETYISLGTEKTAVARTIELDDGSFIFCGSDFNTGLGGGFPAYGMIGKLSSEGDLLWLRQYAYVEGVSPALFYDIIPTKDGGFAATGLAIDTIGGRQNFNVWLLKVDDRGCLVPDCEDDLIITDIEAVGEENIVDGERMLLYPNPTTSSHPSTVYFKKHLTTAATLEVYDALGRWRQRYDLQAFQEQQVLDLEGLEVGAYLCVLKVEGKVVDRVRFLNKKG